MTSWACNDGGREAAGFRGKAGDCVVRAISIATERPYKEVYDAINIESRQERPAKRTTRRGDSRTGVYRKTYEHYLQSLGWKWHPCMSIGSGCRVHLTASELPPGRIICRLSRHLVAVVDGVVQDTYDCSREGTRCVYGYFLPAATQ